MREDAGRAWQPGVGTPWTNGCALGRVRLDGIDDTMDAASGSHGFRDDDAALPDAVTRGFAAARDAALMHVGNTAPNPPVGCAILDRDGALLVTGAHVRAGTPHAEAMALVALRDAGRIEAAHTLIVTLEPCNHTGRTGPCTEAILASPVREVWIGAADPNPLVPGHGAQRLRDAGLSVRMLPPGGLADDCRALIAPFAQRMVAGRPWITVKQALDHGGSMIPPPGASTFTGPASLLLAHRLRRATDAIITGTGTVLADRPGFTVRHLPDHPGRRRLLAVVGRRPLPADWVLAATAHGFDVRQVASPDALPALLAASPVLWAMVEAGPSLLRGLETLSLCDDRLVIEAGSPDRLSVRVARPDAVSPLRLLPELSGLDQEVGCFPVS